MVSDGRSGLHKSPQCDHAEGMGSSERKLCLEFADKDALALVLTEFTDSNGSVHPYQPSDGGGQKALTGFVLLLLNYVLTTLRSATQSKDFQITVDIQSESPFHALATELERKSWIWRIFAPATNQPHGLLMVRTIFEPMAGDYRHGKGKKSRVLRIRGSRLRRRNVGVKIDGDAVTDLRRLKKLRDDILENWRERYARRASTILPRSPRELRGIRGSNSLMILGDEIELPDLLTPGSSQSSIEAAYSAIVGVPTARKLASYWTAAVRSVADGDFAAQERVGTLITEAGSENVRVRGVGLYLTAEGVRLQGDLASTEPLRAHFHEKASQLYHEAIDLVPGDPRPYRGLARIDEYKDRLGEASHGFEYAEMLLNVTASVREGASKIPFIAHERLRVLRHKIHCILHERDSSTSSGWNSVQKTIELEGMVAKCERLHEELMPLFASQARWFQIEWFMGLVFLGKAYGALGEPVKMVQMLTNALAARRGMLAPTATFSLVDYANVEWWISAASYPTAGQDREFRVLVERLRECLQGRDTHAIVRAIDAILRNNRPPWKRSRD
jgi:hypothetical protein